MMDQRAGHLCSEANYLAFYASFLACFLALAVIGAGSACAGSSGTGLSPTQKMFSAALQRDKLDQVKALIAEGADVNMNISGFTPLMLARSSEMIKLLASAGADVNARSELLKQSVLMFEVSQGRLELVKALIESGANVTAQDEKTGMNALSSALMNSHPKVEMIKILIDAGADPNGEIFDNPLLIHAASIGKIDVMRALIDGGADVNIRNKKGATPLMAAVASRKTEAAKFLIDAGADANASANNQSSGARKSRRGESGGHTAMDLANTTGDDELKKMLELEGAKESENPPEPDSKMSNSPGIYSLPCSISGSPPPQGHKFSCSAIDQVAESGTEITTFSMAYFAGKHFVPFEKGKRCQVNLGQIGSYKIRTTTTKTPWELVCRARLGTTTGAEKWIAFIHKKKPVINTTEFQVAVGDSANMPKDEKDPVTIKIVKPHRSEQFSFGEEDGASGALKIEVEAEIRGECDEPVKWKMEKVGDAEPEYEPPTVTVNGAMVVSKLPENNSDFGNKKIWASACGTTSAPVTVEVFFPPEMKNHPNKGTGTTPNWFYYWMQTKAAKDADGNSVKAEYDPDCKGPSSERAQNGVQRKLAGWFCDINGLQDTIYICDAANSKARVESPWITRRTAGIDTFASTVTHEWQHKLDNDSWWGELNENFRPPGKIEETQEWTNYIRMKWVKDRDRDSVPNGKDDFPDKPDGEQANYLDSEDTAYKAEAKWELGAADSEDWSKCGKQWKGDGCE